MDGDYEIFVSPDYKRAFFCDCGKMLLVDESVECDCGAAFETRVVRKD